MLSKIPFIIYLADVCDNLGTALLVLMVILWIVVGVIFIALMGIAADNGMCKEVKQGIKYNIIVCIVSIIFTIGYIACPTAKVMYIYLGTETIESLASNETITEEAKSIYDDVKSLIHGYVEENIKHEVLPNKKQPKSNKPTADTTEE